MATPIANQKPKTPVIANQNGGLNYNTATTAQKQGMQDNWTKLNSDSAYLGSEMARAQQVKTDRAKAGLATNEQDDFITKLSGISAGGAPQLGGETAPAKPTALDYATALSQANNQLDPTYQRAVQNVKTQQYQNQLNGGELASARGGAHSGLAADLQNKVNMSAASDISGLDAQRASQAAEMAQALMYRDQDVNFRNRQQDYTEKSGDAQLGLSRDQFNYGKSRDLVTDGQWNKTFDYNAGRDKVADGQWQTTFDYGKTRDKVADGQWQDTFDYGKSRDLVGDSQWNKTFDRGAFESDRGYDRGVYESDRSYNTPKAAEATTAESMRTYFDSMVQRDENTGEIKNRAALEQSILSQPNLSDYDAYQLYLRYQMPWNGPVPTAGK